MKYIQKFFLLIFFLTNTGYSQQSVDATIISPILFADGLGRHAIIIFEQLRNNLSLSHIKTHTFNLIDVPRCVQHILEKEEKEIGKVALFFNRLWTPPKNNLVRKFMPNCPIKIAYSMLESTEIPEQWVTILNYYCDAVVVPDPFLVDVYRDCGVTIPIFMLPCPITLQDFLAKPLKTGPNHPFVFGMSAGLWPRKNHDLLVEAFIQEFGETDDVRLKIHTRTEDYYHDKANQFKNITLVNKKLRQKDYVDFLSSLDCYVFLPKGEGFSITPREALALGIPCILSNNTVHKTICDSGCVYPIEANIIEPAYYEIYDQVLGNQFDVTIEDVCKAMRDVYENYQHHLQKAHQGREWVKQYDFETIKKTFINLLKPKKVLLGKENVVTEEYLMTDSKDLFVKYLQIPKRKK